MTEPKLPYRIHLVPITGLSIESRSWACGECRRVQMSFEEAKRCCDPKLCERCGKTIGRRSDGGLLVCPECFDKKRADERQAAWDRMPEVPYNNEPIYDDGRFYEHDEEYWDRNYDTKDGEYVELCDRKKLGWDLTADRVLDFIDEALCEDLEPEYPLKVEGIEELRSAIDKFIASQTQEIWIPNGKKAWIEPPEER